jgi:NADPH:quinone reductase-like Zn-dependent oxidoreductase
LRAITRTEYCPPASLRLTEIEPPVLDPDEALVRVRAASVNPLDWHFVRGEPALVRAMIGLRRPKRATIGADLAGIVEAVGADVTLVAPGDEVFGVGHGTFAELARASEIQLASKPAGLSFEQAAALPIAGVTALKALRGTEPGQRLLVIGASGGVGSFAVQLGKAMGAHVTAVCSGPNGDFVRALGADEAMDYTQGPLTGRYDRVVQLAGSYGLGALRRLLAPGGTLVLAGTGTGRDGGGVLGPLPRMARARLMSNVTSLIAHVRRDDLVELLGYDLTPAVEQTFALEDAADALSVLESGHGRGKLVLTI